MHTLGGFGGFYRGGSMIEALVEIATKLKDF